MEIQEIKDANRLVIKLESIQAKISELEKTESVDWVKIERHQSGTPKYSYKIMIDDDTEFMKTIKSLIKDKLKRDEKALLIQIRQIGNL